MDKLLYVAMSGAKGVMVRQAINNHNLSNVNTTGFREDLAASVSYETSKDVLSTRVYADVAQQGINDEPGEIINTGRDLDIAIKGEGMIAVQDQAGTEVYTRSGNLRINPAGMLETSDGSAVMGNNGPIALPPYDSLEIAEDGTISIVPLGDTSAELVVLDRIKLVNPDTAQMRKNEQGALEFEPRLVRKTTLTAVDGTLRRGPPTFVEQRQVAPADSAVGIVSGALETSNVNSASSLINMVELSRIFESQMQLMKTAEDNDAAMDRILT